MPEKKFSKGTRNVPAASEKAPKWYAAELDKKPKVARKSIKPTKLRPSLQPGSVLIILAGRYRGKRVVFLKQLEDTLLVTGPFKINGVPLRRVNPAYVIATSQKVDITGLSLDKFTVDYFKKPKAKKVGTKEEDFFGDKKQKNIEEHRKSDQKTVDATLVSTIRKTPLLAAYLASTFSLSKGDRPHLMKF